jgi:putative transposase
LGHQVSDQTVGNVLRRHGIPRAPERRRTTTWAEFIRAHLAVLVGTEFFTVEVLTLRGLVTYYVLFFIPLESRKLEIAGITTHPTEQWMKQMPRNVTMEGSGALRDSRYLLHDRDTKYTDSFPAIIESVHVKTLRLPARSPEFECPFRTLGKIGEGGVLVKAHSLWRTFLTTSDKGIRCALSR